MMTPRGITGTVYSETIIWMAPTSFVDEAPYQLAIVDLDSGERKTVRIAGARVSIGDRIELSEIRNGVSFFHRAALSDGSSPGLEQ
jgi:hypothetical protein